MRMFSHNAVFEAAQRLSDSAGGWVTQRDPRDPDELDQTLADDPEAKILPPIVNIKVTGDTAAAEAELRKVWDGPQCVTTAERTENELRTIQDEVTTSAGGMLFASVDIMTGTVQTRCHLRRRHLQAELNERYGEGVVKVDSALIPAE
jgi:DNA-directed RNA polymerase specialized sigma24 family protein